MRSRRGDSPLAAISQGRISHLENGGIGDRISYYGRERPPKDSVSGVFSSAHGSSTRFPDDPMSRSADARIACRSPAVQAGKRRKAVARAAHVQVRFTTTPMPVQVRHMDARTARRIAQVRRMDARTAKRVVQVRRMEHEPHRASCRPHAPTASSAMPMRRRTIRVPRKSGHAPDSPRRSNRPPASREPPRSGLRGRDRTQRRAFNPYFGNRGSSPPRLKENMFRLRGARSSSRMRAGRSERPPNGSSTTIGGNRRPWRTSWQDDFFLRRTLNKTDTGIDRRLRHVAAHRNLNRPDLGRERPIRRLRPSRTPRPFLLRCTTSNPRNR